MQSGGRSRKAAEEDEHDVVRGAQGDLVIRSTRVYVGDTGGAAPSPVWHHHMEHHGDPPEQFDDEGDIVMDLDGVPAQHETGVFMISCMFWNCQGAGGKPFLRVLKHLINSYKPGIVSLFEPKVSGGQANDICTKIGFSNWIRVEAVDFSSGIWVFWKDPMQISVLRTHPQYVLMQVCMLGQTPWYLASVYGSLAHHLRRRLWNDLRQVERGFSGPWLAAGDFNTVLNKDETSNYSSFSSYRSADFGTWIQDEGLIDLGFTGAKLTWVKNGNAESIKGARLDRALCNTEWRTRFPGAKVTHLARIASDHAPLFLHVDGERQKVPRAPFVFQAAWLTHTGVNEVVERAWNSDRGVLENTRRVASELATWNMESFRNVFKHKRVLMSRISGIQKVLAGAYHKGLAKLDLKLREELETNDYGVWLTEEKDLRDHIQEFYINLFSIEPSEGNVTNLGAQFPRLRRSDWICFNRAVLKEEVHLALKDMKPFKAPGPDGLQAGFYQHMWDVVGDDVFLLVKEAFATGTLPEGLNETLIALIPKVKDLESIKQFRPISLCNVIYKIVTKTITNRLKRILPKIVGPFQSSFVPGRQISDNVLIFQEVMHTIREKQGAKGYMAIKLDLEKAYDRLS
ncbi:PREDICTED: uncharacterized protein LOC109167347 [Ipomoea nil]|uniref:uncharacterized protein LOC109167347 n=1 Tax=Ipomoea nil TaxID=35883 RepID=UPI000900D241|nr:PREDICTED: uncharacterized protein LOC109167347 [Ipomoea nil]